MFHLLPPSYYVIPLARINIENPAYPDVSRLWNQRPYAGARGNRCLCSGLVGWWRSPKQTAYGFRRWASPSPWQRPAPGAITRSAVYAACRLANQGISSGWCGRLKS